MGRRIRTCVVLLLMAGLLSVGAYAGYQLYTSHRAYAQGDEAYEELTQRIIQEETATQAPQKPSETHTSSTEPARTLDVPEEKGEQNPEASAYRDLGIPDRTVDFDALEAVNSDAIGWLYCPNTVIDYPVMGASDYTYYLRHLPDGTYNINGSLFLDYGCQRDFSDRLSVIYGHNMKTEKMFGTLVNYKSQTYFEEHPYLYLYTRDGNYRIALIYGAVVSADTWIRNSYALDAEGLMSYARTNTTFVSTEEYDQEDRLMVLSTCSYEYDGARYFVVGVLQQE